MGRHFRLIPGGHLFPMETPAAAANATADMIAGLLDEQSIAGGAKKVLKYGAFA